ncbi:aminodeoxychorismate synthase component I [Psychrobium sp. MM17-31]|uniref:aminodeoxychorismate synthase component I n=1 Tax=Psychrobium sp. MM17-31 TaxID=2917758 RepID=UPI001EF706F6|nr:aminodeoxychorismate synthase component I [Psychrobium sp. MM17-31]MCG7531560.1 aminodeoxychorismate synthase component I [Psychrobium sp. MM17-31]
MSAAIFQSQLTIPLSPRELFAHFAQIPWSMFLDSGNSPHVDATTDVIVFEPAMTLLSDESSTTIVNRETGKTDVHNGNPFDLLEKSLASMTFATASSQLPFTGGAVGLFSYDLGRYCEQLSSIAKSDIDAPLMAVGIYRHAIVFNKATQHYTLVSQSDEHGHQQTLSDIYDRLESKPQLASFKAMSGWQKQIDFAQYQQKFQQVQNHLRAGDCYQINLTQRLSMGYQGDEYRAYQLLTDANETPFSAFVRLDDCAILSVSPERFLQTKDQQIETKPIKGTMPRYRDPVKDQASAQRLRNSEKDQSENLMIVDLLRNDIGRTAVAGSVAVPKLFDIESFENVHHLVSTVTAQLPKDVSPIQLLRDAFPGGSITGAPKISAMNIIDSLEPSRRSVYCGSIGYISANGNMDTSITIRTLLATKDLMYCWAGGGIVADSICESEYQECFDKLASIMPVLQES